ncbi:citryl-CoA lyase [Micromonospora inositola]|uniref:citrate synthase (unknown stereospecificity) n=1 Tax=Micromonospora inositola TaxID=47865 RepID=A0A1C5JPZ1_9ACTN|nr:citryl-CoA lyase [Micromonospora inositola]SCG72076.1 citrate synthase [Micromonospora inositola]
MADLTWETGIAEVLSDDVIIRGHRLSDLVGTVTYADMAFLLIRGSLPSDKERLTLEAILVSLADHGISPSTIIGRTLASCGVPVQTAMSGALLSIGDHHGGSGEEVARILVDLVVSSSDADLRERCDAFVADRRRRKEPVPGFGHPQHADGDPRAVAILSIAREHGVAREHCQALAAMGAALADSSGRETLRHPNITGAIAGVLMDLAFPWQAVRGVVLSARCLGMIAHVVEELHQGNTWRHAPSSAVHYIGPQPSDREVSEQTS